MKPSEREKLRLARTSPCKRLSNQPAGNLSRAGLEIGLQGLRLVFCFHYNKAFHYCSESAKPSHLESNMLAMSVDI